MFVPFPRSSTVPAFRTVVLLPEVPAVGGVTFGFLAFAEPFFGAITVDLRDRLDRTQPTRSYERWRWFRSWNAGKKWHHFAC